MIELTVPCILSPAQPGSGVVFIVTEDSGHQNLNRGLQLPLYLYVLCHVAVI